TAAGDAKMYLKAIDFEFFLCLEIAITPVFEVTALASDALQNYDIDLSTAYSFVDGVYCEFNRVVGKNLKDNFFDALDRFSPNLMDLFRKKKGVTDQFLSELLSQTKTTEPTDIGCLCVRGLSIILGDEPSAFFKTCTAGGFGRYQWLHVTLISLPGLMMASQNLLNNFVSGIPPTTAAYRPITAADTTPHLSHYQVDEEQLLRAFIPMDSSGSRLDRCRRFVEPQWQLLAANSSANVSQIPTEGCLDGWAYDRSEFLSTTVSEIVSSSIRYGRRSVLIWSYLQLGVLGCSSAFLPSYSTYCAFRFLSGMAVSGVILNGFSLKVEWIPTKQRTVVGTLTSFFFTFGQMILAGLAYWLRDWRKLQLVVCLPQFLFFSYTWWFSESARWLVLNRRSEDALKSLHRVARVNGKKDIEDTLTLEKEMDSSRSTFTAYDLLRTRQIRRISICLLGLVGGFATSFAYYGLAMDLQKFGVSIYQIQLIFGAMDFPAKLLALGMLSYLGRRVSQATCLFVSAIFIFANILVPA
ncbi:hypothetical protein KUCAC02_009518, partial [Chaenocephalus aceratus]